jgi:hypothetical protein
MERPSVRIAMWSGPRNISTAMMRAWGNRPDTVVCDEPLYSHYLHMTGRAHRGAAEVIAAGETNLSKVIERLTGPIPDGKTIFYQKHMTHHVLAGMIGNWMRQLTHAFLIREPGQMLTSLIKHVPDASLADTGYRQQVEIFDWVRESSGKTPPVLDARDVLENPRRLLGLLCDALGVDFNDYMLSWPPGLRDTDGVWAKYWYNEVTTTTSFQPYRAKNEEVPEHLHELLAECRRYYAQLYAHRLC